jgi:DNA-directed RNA polymerase II subunit RPB1
MFIEYKGTLPPPSILKPKLLWTGKQMLTLVIPRVNFARTNIGKDNVFTWASHPDKHVLIQDGELLCGVMNKGVVGSSAGGLIHIIWKDQGPDACKDFLSDAQNVVNNWLHTQGFTVGVQDIIASEKTVSTIESTL